MHATWKSQQQPAGSNREVKGTCWEERTITKSLVGVTVGVIEKSTHSNRALLQSCFKQGAKKGGALGGGVRADLLSSVPYRIRVRIEVRQVLNYFHFFKSNFSSSLSSLKVTIGVPWCHHTENLLKNRRLPVVKSKYCIMKYCNVPGRQ